MSANNVVWVLVYKDAYYVFYSGCYDNIPETPPPEARKFYDKDLAIIYAFELQKEHGYVEYGVCIHDPEDYNSLDPVVYDLLMRECRRNFREGYSVGYDDGRQGILKTADEQNEYFSKLYKWE